MILLVVGGWWLVIGGWFLVTDWRAQGFLFANDANGCEFVDGVSPHFSIRAIRIPKPWAIQVVL